MFYVLLKFLKDIYIAFYFLYKTLYFHVTIFFLIILRINKSARACTDLIKSAYILLENNSIFIRILNFFRFAEKCSIFKRKSSEFDFYFLCEFYLYIFFYVKMFQPRNIFLKRWIF